MSKLFKFKMVLLSIGLFGLAAVFGLLTLLKVLKSESTSKPIVFLHGGVAAVALVVLLVYTLQNPENAPWLSLIIFGLAALGGFMLFGMDMSKKAPSKPLALVHAVAAVIAFLLLIAFAAGV